MKVNFAAIILVALLALVVGCATQRAERATDTQAVVMCYVCNKNRDLGCVRFQLEKDTPSVRYQGKTYYFCSDKCRAFFAKNPSEYVSEQESK